MLQRLIGLTILIGMLQAGTVCAEDLNPIVGKTNDFQLREADLDRMISYLQPEAQKQLQGNPEQRSAFIQQILFARTIASKARKEGFDKKPEEKEILSYMIDQFLAQEYVSKVVLANVTVSDDEGKKYYDEHLKEFQLPETVKARHIFISSPKDAPPETKAKARAKAEELLQRVRSGEDFSKVAKEHSEDADTAAKGGDLGYITAGKTNSVAFEHAAFALKTAEVSTIVETPFGFHIIKADEKRDQRTASYAESKEYIQALLKEQAKREMNQEFLKKLAAETGLTVGQDKKDIVKP